MSISHTIEADVIVAGGGPAGIGAACAAAALGRKTLLIERGAFMGGVATHAGLGLLINRKAHDRHDIAGRVYQDVIGRMQQRPRAWYRTGGGSCDVVDTEQYKLVLDGMARELGIHVLYHAWVCAVLKEDATTVAGVRALTREGMIEVRAPLCVDATGDAAVAAAAGCSMQQIAAPQPMTAVVKLSNVDVATTLREYGGAVNEQGYLVLWGLHDEFRRARGDKFFAKIPVEGIAAAWSNPANASEVIVNGNRILRVNGVVAAQLSAAEMEGREQAEELAAFFRRYIPGFEQCCVAATGPVIGVRETRRIIGEYTLTEDDVLAMCDWEDAIAACAYAIDVHSATDSTTKLVELHTRGKGAYTIPFRACVPRGFKGLLAAGRCISADTGAAGSFRVMPSCMSLGEGAVSYALTGASTALDGYRSVS